MDPKKLLLVFCLAALPFWAGGCMADLVLQFNGRTVEVQKLYKASFPRGVEIPQFDGGFMMLNGKEAITINGKPLTVNGPNVTYGNFVAKVDLKHKVIIKKTGEIHIEEQTMPSDVKSWWEFWR